MSENYVLKEHREWITSLQPVGLVVSANALEHAQLRLQKDVFEAQETFKSLLDSKGQLLPLHVVNLFTRFLGWRQEDLVSGEDIKDLQAYLPEREIILKPDYAVRNIDTGQFDILIKIIDGLDLDEKEEVIGRGWDASPHTKFERLLRENNIAVGILINQSFLRMIYAPKGETSGYMTFPLSFMREVQGRAFIAGLKLLLGEDRLFRGPSSQRLQTLLTESRKFQNDVSTQLSEQVLIALYELVRGFQAANIETNGNLLRETLEANKNEVYHGLLTVLLRTVFILYAEDRDLISTDSIFLNNYSVNGLYSKLREDFNRHHDSMDLRYGAWAHLLSLYRIIYNGIDLETDSIPARKSQLFDPDAFPFLEGRTKNSPNFNPPKVSDGVIWKVLSNLMTLDGDRISYRALDVEQIGSVYETIMGFQLEIATGPSIAIRSPKQHGAPFVINLDEILNENATTRASKLKELTDHKFEGKIAEAIRLAKTPEDLVIAIGNKVAERATPTIVEQGSLILQPSDERRRSGSHYTPRTLTAPIVEKSLAPIISNLGHNPTPEKILELKICDPAMGSGAFLVEACRQLSDLLVKSWAIHKPYIKNELPPDEDELLYARRLIAQRCLYGVDKNPMAVNLSKLSLWLATFARQHDFTFLDHAIKSGDSLVGLTGKQILSFTWSNAPELTLQHNVVADKMKIVKSIRDLIRDSSDSQSNDFLTIKERQANEVIKDLKVIGDVVLSCFFMKTKDKDRIKLLEEKLPSIETWLASGLPHTETNSFKNEIRWLHQLIVPFYWDLEFPEVFADNSSGFDCMIGNPPFMSGSDISQILGENYNNYLVFKYPPASRKTDLSAFFLRRSSDLLKSTAAIGMITTNTISQGDTRRAGLDALIEKSSFQIIYATSDLFWPGVAAVVVSEICCFRGDFIGEKILNNQTVDFISTSLDSGVRTSEAPRRLASNRGICYAGVYPLGESFVITDDQARDMIAKNKKNREVVLPTIGGQDLNNESDPTITKKWLINFGELSESDARLFVEPFEYLYQNIRPDRVKLDGKKYPRLVNEWWKLWHARHVFFNGIKEHGFNRFLARARVSNYHALQWLPAEVCPLETAMCFLTDQWSDFAVLQSTVHEAWVRRYSSTLKTDVRYTSKDCFENFPLPKNNANIEALADEGKSYYEYRADLMKTKNMGLTEIYRRFHTPAETSKEIIELRRRHQSLDITVLDAYGLKLTNLDYIFIEQQSNSKSPKAKKKFRLELPPSISNSIISHLINLNLEESSSTNFDDDMGDLDENA